MRELVRAHRPLVIFLYETLTHSNKIEELRSTLGFEAAFSVDREGRSGGIAVLWKFSDQCTVTGYSRNHIDVRITEPGKEEWRLTGYYGFPEQRRRREAWNFLKALSRISQLPWCIIGDFNDILDSSEKRGQIDRPIWMIHGFREAVMQCNLQDIHMKGHPFTWEKGRGKTHFVEEKLDRALASTSWAARFPEALVTNTVATCSDHSPILLATEGQVTNMGRISFRFENRWMEEDDFINTVTDMWETTVPSETITNKLQVLSTALMKWSKKHSKVNRKSIEELKTRINRMRSLTDHHSVTKVEELKQRLNQLMIQHDIYWKQRAKQFWLKEGDLNTKFFHSMATRRKAHNRIQNLTDDTGKEFNDPQNLERIVGEYFGQLFLSETASYDEVINQIEPKLTAVENNALLSPFTIDEFREALFQMDPNKSPGPDGYNPGFFQKCWHIMGEELFQQGVQWMNQVNFPTKFNDTIITLIPKCANPNNMKDLRPISLCNVMYRVFAKVLAKRLKLILPQLISETQAAFVQGRSIIDNVIVAFEIIHHMKRKNRGKHGDVALKIDISKAYDRIDWGFLKLMMLKLGFDDRWVDLMMLCVTTVRYHVRVNGNLVGPITPKRGLRQGCPLSPYLFIICTQGLSTLIEKAEGRGTLHGVKICRRAPIISHLFFADDSFIFFRATNEECAEFRKIITTYERASGQAINFEKSGIFFSKNIETQKQEELSLILGVSKPLDTGRYLGLPSLIGSKKKVVFKYLRDRLWNRIQNWRGNALSKAGKEVLLKSVAHALPAYCMNVFLLPTSLLDELQKMMNSFWWGTTSQNSRGIHWTNWNRICTRKESGGLGFRNLEAYNLAMLAKQGWKLISTPNTLSSRLLKAKYFPDKDFMETSLGSNPSFIWRSIWNSKAILAQGLRWKVGDGQCIKIWTHPWLRDPNNFYIQTPHLHQEEVKYVKDLLIPDTRQWNKGKLQETFTPRDVQEIMNIPLNPLASYDDRIWHFSGNGIYTVKSGYRIIMETITNQEQVHRQEGEWSKIWSLSTPPKIRSLLWRAARDFLPNRLKLQSRNIQVPSSCVICESGLENNWHVFIDCPYAKECWKIAKLDHLVTNCAREATSFSNWIFDSLEKFPKAAQEILSATLWSIWRYRNEKLWSGVSRPPQTTVTLGYDMLWNWTQAQKNHTKGQGSSSRRDADDRWTKPPDPSMKCNVDAALFNEHQAVGFGAVVRDSAGDFMVSKTSVTYGLFEVKEAEALALLDAIAWTTSIEIHDIIFETDSMMVVNAINSKSADHTEFGSIISSCRKYLEAHPSFKIKHVRRQANMVAHSLARAAISHANPFITVHPLDILCNFISHDCEDIS